MNEPFIAKEARSARPTHAISDYEALIYIGHSNNHLWHKMHGIGLNVKIVRKEKIEHL